MTPQEIALLKKLGSSVFPKYLVTPIVGSVWFGISLLLSLYAIAVFRPRRITSRPTSIMFWTTVVCLGFAIITFAGELAGLSSDFDLVGLLELSKKYKVPEIALFSRTWTSILVKNWIDSFGFIISDLVVIWRAWVLLPSRRPWFAVAPGILLLASVATSLAACILASRVDGVAAVTTNIQILVDYLTLSSTILSLATNVVTTSVFAFRLWSHRRFLSDNHIETRSSSTSVVQRSLYLMIESGILFCLTQTALIIGELLFLRGVIRTLKAFIIFNVIFRFQYSLSIIYPTLVFVLVRTRNSVVDAYEMDTYNAYHEKPTVAGAPSLTTGATADSSSQPSNPSARTSNGTR